MLSFSHHPKFFIGFLHFFPPVKKQTFWTTHKTHQDLPMFFEKKIFFFDIIIIFWFLYMWDDILLALTCVPNKIKKKIVAKNNSVKTGVWRVVTCLYVLNASQCVITKIFPSKFNFRPKKYKRFNLISAQFKNIMFSPAALLRVRIFSVKMTIRVI